jgi:hypothetical protein
MMVVWFINQFDNWTFMLNNIIDAACKHYIMTLHSIEYKKKTIIQMYSLAGELLVSSFYCGYFCDQYHTKGIHGNVSAKYKNYKLLILILKT